MRELLKDIKWSLILASLLYLFLGLALLIWPHTSNLILCCIVAGVLTAYGLFNIIAYFGKSGAPWSDWSSASSALALASTPWFSPPVSATSSLSSWASPFWWTALPACGGILSCAERVLTGGGSPLPWTCSS